MYGKAKRGYAFMNKKKKEAIHELYMILMLIIAIVIYIKTKNAKLTMIIVIAVFVVLMIIYAEILIHIKRKFLEAGIDKIDKFEGEEFEKLLFYYYKELGYKVKLTPQTNDFGADLILRKNGEVTVVQAKRYKSSVGIKAVQEVIGAKAYYKAHKCVVATNSYFTKSAIDLAEANCVELINRKDLFKMMKEVKENNNINNYEKVSEIKESRICAKCGAPMVLRYGKNGQFYGCTNFPKCKYTENYREQ